MDDRTIQGIFKSSMISKLKGHLVRQKFEFLPDKILSSRDNIAIKCQKLI